jgi:hypothetical protein
LAWATRHVLAGVLDIRRVASAGREIGCEVDEGLVIAAAEGKEHPLGLQVVHDGV